MLIDTHCHLDITAKKMFNTPLSDNDLPEVALIIEQAQAKGVSRFITVGTSVIESENCIKMAHAFPCVYAAIGIHPNDCTPQFAQEFLQLKKLLANNKRIVAIGETGLDYHHPDFNVQRQKDCFKAQIELALESNRALIVHTRKAFDETMSILTDYKNDLKRCVIHSFSEDLTSAQNIIEYGWMIGINATVTYPKNNMLRSIVTMLPLTSLLLETDSPFLPPQTMRGQQNTPASIAIIADYVANLRGTSLEEVARTTSNNACLLFGIEP